MIHKNCLEGLDKSLQDIMHDDDTTEEDKVFGGKTIHLEGDFRQIFLVIPSNGKHDIINALICKSPLCDHCKIFTLHTNMRLLNQAPS